MPLSFPTLCPPSQVLQNLTPFTPCSCNGTLTMGLASTAAFALGYFIYTRCVQVSHVDQLFARVSVPAKDVREHLSAKGYSHLSIVPKEEVNLPDPIGQIVQYVENPRKFDKAVAEFAKFALENCVEGICKKLVDSTPDFLSGEFWQRDSINAIILSLSHVANCKSFPLFIENGEGKIGIINPDIRICEDPKVRDRFMAEIIKTEDLAFVHLKSLFYAFPCHKEIILDVLKRVFPQVGIDEALDEDVKDQRGRLEVIKKAYPLYTKWKSEAAQVQ